MGETGFEEMGAYVLKRKNTDAQYIETWPFLDLYEDTVQRSGVGVSRRWWD